MQALIFFGHGARDPRWKEPFDKLAKLWKKNFPKIPVSLAFLELMDPSLLQAISSLNHSNLKEIIIVPVFFGQGSHLRNDFPFLVETCKQSFPHIHFRVAPPVGEDLDVLQAVINGANRYLCG